MTLRFLKKFRKPSKKSKPPETTQQITDIGTGDSDGEFLLRMVLGLMRPMRLIRSSGQIPTTEGVLASQFGMRGLEINNFLRRLPRSRLLDTGVTMQVSATEFCLWGRCLSHVPIAPQTQGGSVEAQSEKLQGPGVQQPSETDPERTSRGESRCSGDTIVSINRYCWTKAGLTRLLGVLWSWSI